jgi:hypothetical protein
MKRSGTCLAAGAALSLVLASATAASHAAAGSHPMGDAAMPQRSTIAYAIVKSIVARNIATLRPPTKTILRLDLSRAFGPLGGLSIPGEGLSRAPSALPP